MIVSGAQNLLALAPISGVAGRHNLVPTYSFKMECECGPKIDRNGSKKLQGQMTSYNHSNLHAPALTTFTMGY